jgi:hypothetical protein
LNSNLFLLTDLIFLIKRFKEQFIKLLFFIIFKHLSSRYLKSHHLNFLQLYQIFNSNLNLEGSLGCFEIIIIIIIVIIIIIIVLARMIIIVIIIR